MSFAPVHINQQWDDQWPWDFQQAERSEFTSQLRLLVVDDDPIFCKAISRAARKRGVHVRVCDRLSSLTMLPDQLPYDAVILDYYFRGLTGTQLSFMLGKDLPIVMVSASEKTDLFDSAWPECVREFIHKGRGIEAILDAAGRVSGKPTTVDVQTQTLERPWALVALTATLALITLAAALLAWGDRRPAQRIFWDRLDNPSVEIAMAKTDKYIRIWHFEREFNKGSDGLS